MNLGQQFRSKVITAEPDALIHEAVVKMKRENVGAIVVVEGKRVVGIVTDRDIAMAVVLGGIQRDVPVSEIMTKDVVTIWEDEDVFNATQYFTGHHFRRLPIVTRDNEVVGIITTDDLLALLARELCNVTRPLEAALAFKDS